MSQLEKLPIELLETIFFCCLNINLPRASLILGTTLSSSRIKINLLVKVFSSSNSGNVEHYDELQRILWTGKVLSTEKAIGKLQSDILQCRWMTPDFMKLYMETHITRTILREFREQELPWQDLQPVQDLVVQQFVHEVFNTNVKLGIDPVRDLYRGEPELDNDQMTTEEEWRKDRGDKKEEYQAMREYMKHSKVGIEEDDSRGMKEDEEELASSTSNFSDPDAGFDTLGITRREYQGNDPDVIRDTIVTSSLVTRTWSLDDTSSRIAVGIGPRTGVLILGACLQWEDDENLVSMNSPRWRCLFDSTMSCEVPAKLCKGPWTKEKLNFLEAVLDAGAGIDSRDRLQIASQGLMDAVEEDNYRAIDLIAGETFDAQNTEYMASVGIYVEPSFSDARFDFPYFDDCGHYVEPCVTEVRERILLNISPNTEHLKAAVLQRGCYRMIVRRLLFARNQKIDHKDPSIAVWIEKTTREGDKKGQWLQYQLDKSDGLKAGLEARREAARGNLTPVLSVDSDEEEDERLVSALWAPWTQGAGAICEYSDGSPLENEGIESETKSSEEDDTDDST